MTSRGQQPTVTAVNDMRGPRRRGLFVHLRATLSGERCRPMPVLPGRCAALLLAVALSAIGCESAATPTPPSAPVIRRVVVLGDSLAVSPSRDLSFPARLQARISSQSLPYTIVNAGIDGDTTAGGLARLPPLLSADCAVLVIALGANDGLQGLDLAIVEQNLAAMIVAGQRSGARVLLSGMEVPPFHGLSYTLAFHSIFPRLAQQHAVPLVPFLLAGVALVPALNGPDGVHPNAVGAERIADTVWPHLRPLLPPVSSSVTGGLATGS